MTTSIVTKVIKAANGIKCRVYRSQPMPESYSKLVRYANGVNQPSQMQQAFMNAVLAAKGKVGHV